MSGGRGFENLVLISGTKNTTFAQAIASRLNVPLADTTRTSFKDTDLKVRIADHESVRGKDVYLVMTYEPSVAELLQETIVWTDALLGGSADRLTVVLPFLFGSRQDRKTARGEPINARAYTRAIMGAAGEKVSRLGFMTSDLHAPQVQGYAMDFDNLTALPLFAQHIKQAYPNNSVVIISPDAGGLKRAEDIAHMIGTPEISWIAKSRDRTNGGLTTYGLGNPEAIEGKTAILVDDMVDTGRTLLEAGKLLRKAGAHAIAVYATHLLLSDDAMERMQALREAYGVRVVGTDTVYHLPGRLAQAHIETIPFSSVFAEAIRRKNSDQSTKELFTRELPELCGINLSPRPTLMPAPVSLS